METLVSGASYREDPLTGPCGRCGKLYSEHPGGFCPDGVGPDGMVDVMDAPIYVPADEAEEASATEGFSRFYEKRTRERDTLNADHISWRKATLPGSTPGERAGYVARNGEFRAYVQPRATDYVYGALMSGPLTPTLTREGTTGTLQAAKAAAFAIVRRLKEAEMPNTAEAPKKAPGLTIEDLRAALVAAIEEAVPGATRTWNKTRRYETFKIDGHAFGLVFKAGARSLGVKIPGQLREIKVSETAGFTKSDYGLTRSLTKRGEIRSVAKVFSTAAEAALKKAEKE
jgi:hypothetical protein